MRILGYLVVFLGGLVTCYLLFSMGVVAKMNGIPNTQQEPMLLLPTYLGFLSVLLTAVTAVLAALAIGIGIVAAYTFKELKAEAREASKAVSQSVAKEVAAEALSEVRVKKMVLELYAAADAEKHQKQEWGDEPADSEDR
jgi:uncharacterized membrane protein YccC